MNRRMRNQRTETNAEEFGQLLSELLVPLRKVLEHPCMDDEAADTIADAFMDLLNNFNGVGFSHAELTEVVIRDVMTIIDVGYKQRREAGKI